MEKNKVTMKGFVKEELKRTEIPGLMPLYETILSIPRLSGRVDEVPLVTKNGRLKEGDLVALKGELRSHFMDEGPRKLKIYVLATGFLIPDEMDDSTNMVILDGIIKRREAVRVTPRGTQILDFKISVPRTDSAAADYIPAIAWNAQANQIYRQRDLTRVNVTGRLQSRQYEKRGDDGIGIPMTAYELSVSDVIPYVGY